MHYYVYIIVIQPEEGGYIDQYYTVYERIRIWGPSKLLIDLQMRACHVIACKPKYVLAGHNLKNNHRALFECQFYLPI